MGNARLRTKTGCFTCRKRRVKCGEEKPSCRNCSSHSRQCVWPTSNDLCDRRHGSREGRRLSPCSKRDAPSPNGQGFSDTVVDKQNETGLAKTPGNGCPSICSEIESELFYYFLNGYSPLLVLATWDKSSFQEYQSQVVCMMMHCKSVKFAVLATCASNKYIRSRNRQYQRVALIYYSRAVEEMNQAVVRLQSDQDIPDLSILTAVTYLYIYDLWSLDAIVDPRKHVAGAIKLLNLRCGDNSSRLSMSRALERLTAESIFYQAFLLTMRRPFTAYFTLDAHFMDLAESILDSKRLISTTGMDSSPVLGMPLSLYRLIVDVINFYHSAEPRDPGPLNKLRIEMEYWEAYVLTNSGKKSTSSDGDFSAEMIILYVLAASLLLDLSTGSSSSEASIHAFSSPNRGDTTKQSPSHPDPWQLRKGLEILRRPDASTAWLHGFLGPWPILIFGYVVIAEDDIMVLRTRLLEILQWLGYGEVQRILEELEGIWSSRESRGLGASVVDG